MLTEASAARRKSSAVWVDAALALAIALIALAAYVRTLAPDLLYSDSAEFQTLAYTLGTTHSTGYPIYLLLARLVGMLPVESMAWRINLFSAIGGAAAVGMVYVATRYATGSRVGAAFASAALALSPTFWSQSVIAEVYTPSVAFLAAVTVLAFHWQAAPVQRVWAAFATGMLWGVGLGVHASLALYLPALLTLLAVTLVPLRDTPRALWRALAAAAGGAALGVALFIVAFVAIDLNNPPSSFIQVALSPSRSIWGLTPADLDSSFERLWLTFASVQWRSVMFPKSVDDPLVLYLAQLASVEFTPFIPLAALAGLAIIARRRARLAAYLAVAYVGSVFFTVNYRPGDQYIFFLPTYLPVVIAMGVAIGWVIERVGSVAARWGRAFGVVAQVVMAVGLAALALGPRLPASANALADGAASFSTQSYVYPVTDLAEPRRIANQQLSELPENALAIADWRALYSQYYLAHAEGTRPDVAFMEAMPYGAGGRVADSLIETIATALATGRPVLADNVYPGLRENFNVENQPGTGWYRLTPR